MDTSHDTSSSREDNRISVESLTDWHRIKANYAESVLAVLEETIASEHLESQRDVLVAHATSFIDRTFEIAQPNLRVNGRNFDEHEQETDPFDEALDRRIWTLADARLACYKSLSETRRTVPRDLAQKIEEAFARGREVEEMEGALGIGKDLGDKGDLDSGDEASFTNRYPHITDGFHRTAALTEALNQVIPNQQERSSRFETAAAEIKGLKP